MQQTPQRPAVDNVLKPSILAWRAKYQAEKAEQPAETTPAEAMTADQSKRARDRRPIPGRNRTVRR